MKGWMCFAILVAQALATFNFSPDQIERIKGKQRYEPAALGNVLKYTRPTIATPIYDLLDLQAATLVGQTRLDEGFVDVTQAPFSADPTGRVDATKAIQQAIDFSRETQRACWFPPGDYLVSDTLVCAQGLYMNQNGRIRPDRSSPNVLWGAGPGPRRSRLVLAPHAVGFKDAAKPKYVVHFMVRDHYKDPANEGDPNVSFSQIMIGLDVLIGEGNPGAVAIKHQAAQGSTIQDATLDATHGLKCLEGSAGSGGSHHGLTLIGGEIGADFIKTQPAPTLSACVFSNQRRIALYYGGRQTLTAVGLRIHVQPGCQPVQGDALGNQFCQGPMSLIDCAITFAQAAPGNVAFKVKRNLFLQHVYVKNGSKLVEVDGGESIPTERTEGWIHVERFALPVSTPPNKGFQYTHARWLASDKLEGFELRSKTEQAPPSDLFNRHSWGGGFPAWHHTEVINARSAGAKGDGVSDDHPVLQRLCTSGGTVFLPRGLYRLSRTLVLGPKTKLIGLGEAFSLLVTRPEDSLYFSDPLSPKPLLETVDDAQAETTVAFIGVFVPDVLPGAHPLSWRAGSQSAWRSSRAFVQPWIGYGAPTWKKIPRGTPLATITGQGGGRFWNLYLEDQDEEPGFRHLLVSGTRQPLRFYQLNTEHSLSEANTELRDAQNIDIYGMKGEFEAPMLWVNCCDHIRLYGSGGNAQARAGNGLFRVDETPNFLLANLIETPVYAERGDGKDTWAAGKVAKDPATWFMINETWQGKDLKCPAFERPVIYERGRNP